MPTTSKFFATEDFYWRRINNEIVTVVSKVGQPYETRAGDWRCDVELTGIRQPTFVSGASSMQALQLAIVYASLEIANAIQAGGGHLLDHPNDDAQPLTAFDVLMCFDPVVEFISDPSAQETWKNQRAQRSNLLDVKLAACTTDTIGDHEDKKTIR